jgi:hypothetical protein
MLVDEDLTKCRVLTNAEMLAQVHMALLLNARVMPQLKGAGAIKDQPRRDAAIRMFAAEVTAQLLVSTTRLILGPPAGGWRTARAQLE